MVENFHSLKYHDNFGDLEVKFNVKMVMTDKILEKQTKKFMTHTSIIFSDSTFITYTTRQYFQIQMKVDIKVGP